MTESSGEKKRARQSEGELRSVTERNIEQLRARDSDGEEQRSLESDQSSNEAVGILFMTSCLPNFSMQ